MNKNNHHYRIKVKSEQSTHRWSDFKRVRLQISVGAPYHEGEKLAAIARWVASRFDEVDLHVNDTLQRHDLMFERDLSESAARKLSAQEGINWIERNAHLFNDIPGLTLRRWDHWLSHPLFENIYKKTSDIYAENHQFRTAINQDILDIWTRRKNAGREKYIDAHKKTFYEMSRRYLLEEVAAFAVMAETRPAIDVYPGSTLHAETVFQGQDIPGAPSGLGRGYFCRIDFARNTTAVEPLAA